MFQERTAPRSRLLLKIICEWIHDRGIDSMSKAQKGGMVSGFKVLEALESLQAWS